jgi:hypothetical protein
LLLLLLLLLLRMTMGWDADHGLAFPRV